MKKSFRLVLLITILIVAAFPQTLVEATVPAQEIDPVARAQVLKANLTPEERVGQLFLVTFKGTDVSEKSQIYDLIVNHHIGGVALRASNDNFTGPENTLGEISRLTTSLQQDEWAGSQIEQKDPVTKAAFNPQYVPLIISVSQEDNRYSYDQIMSGVTPLPSLMAIGATWNPDLSKQVGNVLGTELEALGVNMLFGPSLDVFDILRVEGDDLGTRSFGGDPYWVGEMGKAYIEGIHEGSRSRIAVIAKHFPGRGGADRSPDTEVATIRKSLEQLKQIDLAPFQAVTSSNNPSPLMTTEGLFVSHIRYQGFQGNIRATTRPVSLDQSAMDQLLALDPFATWRQKGGIVVSDSLGSEAVRKFFDPTTSTFDARQVARTAFQAGNDLLYIDNFISPGDPDAYTTILRTLDYFSKKYREDPAFAQRVDSSVERILALKFKLYPEFNLSSVLPVPTEISNLSQSQTVSFNVANAAATLVSPSPGELASVLPKPPDVRNRIVFISDTLAGKQCTQCAEGSLLSVDSLKTAVLKLYGPNAGGQTLEPRLFSYSYIDLQNLLNGMSELKQMETDLKLASWIVFAARDINSNRPESNSLKRFLSERPDLYRNKQLIVFSFSAPYYLDATDISKITAYYALYSTTPPFIELAARLLFQEFTPAGSLPISVPGIGYDLIVATSPDPNQVISIYVDSPEQPASTETTLPGTTLEPTPIPTFKIGDTLPLKTGIILDHNHNPVPDGTVVRFSFTVGGELTTAQQSESVTSQGVAKIRYPIQTPGLIEIRVSSDPAFISEVIRLDISQSGSASVTEIAPTEVPTQTKSPTNTATIEIKITPTPIPAPTGEINPADWFLAMLVIWGCGSGIFWIGRKWVNMRWGIRWGLSAIIGGLIAFVSLAIELPGNQKWMAVFGRPVQILIIFGGILLGWIIGFSWRQVLEKRHKRI